ncbi:vancomycin high temperature exclusion protein [Pontiella sp.]|uniref:SanA/YdcF family protein n=1 Tax=Pontiella sp. TaxID=2837462 RepID=UPI003563D1ED
MFRRLKNKWFRIGVPGCALLALVAIVAARQWMVQDTRGRVFAAAGEMPARHVGLVLGCSPRLQNGRSNLYFRYRMQAAHELFAAGKVGYLIVSGDNHIRSYDEAGAMKDALVELGVPADRIVCDYAGFSTLDSVVRARDVFGQREITIVSQRFHAQRAVFIARRKGIDAIGYGARDLTPRCGLRTLLREQLARVKTILDLYLLNRRPRFLGDPIQIGQCGGFGMNKA